MKNFLILSTIFLTSLTAHADEKKNLVNIPVSNVLDQSAQYTDEKFTLELFSYEENIYSQSRKTELGDQLKLNTRFRYQINDNAWMSMGFKTDPDVNRSENKTSDFEVRAGYNYEDFVVQADLSVNTNDDGGMSFGMDLDSENTFLRYAFNDNFSLSFFPFNFDGEVGVEFETYDVTRIYYIEGTPNQINENPNADDPAERIANKTIPGFVLSYNEIADQSNFLNLYVGAGLATYEFPNSAGFDIRDRSAGNSWARKETFGYKFGGVLRNQDSFTSFQYVGQTEDQETGVLLKSAASLYNLSYISNFVVETEVTGSEGGRKPYRIDFSTDWFDLTESRFQNVRQRVYSDSSQIPGEENQIQDWAGKWGFAGSLKFGLRRERVSPYLSYKYQDKYFVYSGNDSAQILRTKDLSESHGGLHRIGFGAYFYNGNFIVNPRFEYLLAENDVFTESGDITNEPQSQTFRNTDFLLMINVSYFYDKRTGPRTFRL